MWIIIIWLRTPSNRNFKLLDDHLNDLISTTVASPLCTHIRARWFLFQVCLQKKKKRNGSDNNDCCACVGIYLHSPSESFTYKQSDMIIILLLLYNTAAAVCCRKLSLFWRMLRNKSRGTCSSACLHITHTHTLSLVH